MTRLTLGLAWLGLAVSLLSALALLVSGPGTRVGLWSYGSAFGFMRWAAFGGIAGAVIAVTALLLQLKFPAPGAPWRGVIGLILGVIAVGVPWYWLSKARSVPPIHDITTDFADPPEFQAVLALRAEAPNDAAYGGPEIARQQQQAYPQLDTLIFTQPPAQVFPHALAAARELGWEIVAAEEADGRIEATDTTAWFGFKDDVVIRVAPAQSGTAVDIRSVSRVGRSDVGANAARIRKFSAALSQRMRS